MSRSPVVFDCDGVLVDSEALSWSAWNRCAELFGVALTTQDQEWMSGRRAVDIYERLAGRGGLPPGEEFLAGLEGITATIFEEHLEAFEDAEDTVDHLARLDFPLAVASSSTTPRLELALRVTGLDQAFTAVVAGDEVERGKPAPDLYLGAARALGVDPHTCTAVEDSPPGILSARAAGMRVVAVDRGLFDLAQLGEADLVVPRLTPAAFLG